MWIGYSLLSSNDVVGRNAYPWWRCPKISLLFENVGVDKHVNGVKDDETEEYTLVR
jgi:hypothetical protein